MNTNEIPIKLPERYTRGDDRFHVIHEDDINDDSKEGEKNIPLIVLSFFLSFFRAYEFRRSAKRISAGKQNRTRNVSVYEDSVMCISLSLLVSFVATKRKGFVDCVARSRECRTATRPRRSRNNVSFVLTTRVYSNT